MNHSLCGKLAAFAFHHPTELRDRNGTVPAELVTINAAAARVRLGRAAGDLYAPGRRLRLNPCLPRLDSGPEGLDCIVDWLRGNEIGVRFATPLPMGIHDLQDQL
ncbi:MAG: hypothetical protein H0S85_03670 [Desulfovibrionaceae bacterium]|jgi:hypothetical protein|nr:hypothetical protein [Desulfovibrionaceae bacterium]